MSVAVPQQDEIEVFINETGSITIRQFVPTNGESGMVVVQGQNVAALIRAVRAAQRELKESEAHGH